METPTAKRKKYEANFKLQVIEMAKEMNNCAAARKYQVTEKMVRDWRKNEDSIRKMPRQKCAMRTGLTRWPDLENHVMQWAMDQRESGCLATRNMIREYALKWSKLHPEKCKNFKATSGWCTRFMIRIIENLNKESQDILDSLGAINSEEHLSQ